MDAFDNAENNRIESLQNDDTGSTGQAFSEKM